MTADRPDELLGPLRRSVPDDVGIDARVADRIEAGLRAAHADRRRAPAPWRRVAILVPAAMLLVVALAIGLLARDGQPSAAFVVTDAENVTVMLADGRTLRNPADGFVLPDGARIEIGAGGRVTIDDITIDERATDAPVVLAVRDGRLVTDVVATTTAPERPDHLEPATPPPDTSTTTTEAAPTTTAPDPPTTTAPTERPPTTTTQPPSTTTTRPIDDGSDRRDEPRPDDPPDDDRPEDDRRGDPEDGLTVTLALGLERVDEGIEIAWSVEGLADGWSVVVLRVVDREQPVSLVTTTDATGTTVDAVARGDRDGPRPRYRLIVLDEAGGEVAAGPVQSLR